MKESILEKLMRTELGDPRPVNEFIDKWIGPPMSQGRLDLIFYVITGCLIVFFSYLLLKHPIDKFCSSKSKLAIFCRPRWTPLYIPLLIMLWPLILVLGIIFVLGRWAFGLVGDLLYVVGLR